MTQAASEPSPEPILSGRISSLNALATRRLLPILSLLAFGIPLLWRLIRYGRGFAIWGDEASVLLNLWERSYHQLLAPLDYEQVAPVLFLWLQRWVLVHLGSGDRIVRLVPFLACLAALLLCARYRRWRTGRLRPLLVLAFIGSSILPVRIGLDLKPYSLDLLVAMGLSALALERLRGNQSPWIRWSLLGLVPLTMGISYPSVFIWGTVLMALLVASGTKTKSDWYYGVALSVLVAGCFLGIFLLVGRGQHAQTRQAMEDYWVNGFMPAEPLKALWWLWDVHPRTLLCYPVPTRYVSGLPVFALMALGVVSLGRARRWAELTLWTGPFLLTFAASLAHRYPYGGDARIQQHLLPAIAVLTAQGFGVLVWGLCRQRKWPRQVGRLGLMSIVAGLTIYASVSATLDWARPYVKPGPAEARDLVGQLSASITPGQVCLICSDPSGVDQATQDFRHWTLRSHLWYLTRAGLKIEYIDQLPKAAQRLESLKQTSSDFWICDYGPLPPRPAPPGWKCQLWTQEPHLGPRQEAMSLRVRHWTR